MNNPRRLLIAGLIGLGMASTSQAGAYYSGGYNPGGFSMGTYGPGAYGGAPYAVPYGQTNSQARGQIGGQPNGQPHGQSNGPAQSAPQSIDTRNLGPEDMLRVGVDAVQTFLSSGDTGNRQMALAFLKEQVTSYFDFAYMSRWVAGGSWRRMNDAQKVELESTLKDQFLNTLANGIGGYADSRVKVLKARASGQSEVLVPVAVTNRSGQTLRMDFRFYQGKQGWRIFDVKANGQSAVIHYRRQFQSLLRSMTQPQSWR